jgi:branched-subunit amino acid aminotransferase/4-amino-4-deoxychorismate lyase
LVDKPSQTTMLRVIMAKHIRSQHADRSGQECQDAFLRFTPCIGGITRENVILICREVGIPVFEKNFSLTDVYGADEAFVTGTFAGLVPARSVDGRVLTAGRGPMTERLQGLYKAMVEADVAAASRP